MTIFEDSEDLPRLDWSLARDLIYIRVLDRLYDDPDWFNSNSSAVQEAMDKIEQTEQQEEQEAAAS